VVDVAGPGPDGEALGERERDGEAGPEVEPAPGLALAESEIRGREAGGDEVRFGIQLTQARRRVHPAVGDQPAVEERDRERRARVARPGEGEGAVALGRVVLHARLQEEGDLRREREADVDRRQELRHRGRAERVLEVPRSVRDRRPDRRRLRLRDTGDDTGNDADGDERRGANEEGRGGGRGPGAGPATVEPA